MTLLFYVRVKQKWSKHPSEGNDTNMHLVIVVRDGIQTTPRCAILSLLSTISKFRLLLTWWLLIKVTYDAESGVSIRLSGKNTWANQVGDQQVEDKSRKILVYIIMKTKTRFNKLLLLCYLSYIVNSFFIRGCFSSLCESILRYYRQILLHTESLSMHV